MKKLILKTAFITLGATVIVLVAVFGLMSLWAPAVMMDLTASLGMNGISGDYAYQEYERSGDISYLSRSFIIAAEAGDNRTAEKRFEVLYEHEEFDSFCDGQSKITLAEGIEGDYRSYVCGLGACLKYRLSDTEEDKEAAYTFAVEETASDFPFGNPVFMLATEAASEGDKDFCRFMYETLYPNEQEFQQNLDYISIVVILAEVAYE